MCDKLPYENPRIDTCLRKIVDEINNGEKFHTVASCCGHGKYPATIVIRDINGYIYEYYSRQLLDKAKKHRYYRKDKQGYYYISQIMKEIDKNG